MRIKAVGWARGSGVRPQPVERQSVRAHRSPRSQAGSSTSADSVEGHGRPNMAVDQRDQ